MNLMHSTATPTRLRWLENSSEFPALQREQMQAPLWREGDPGHAPRILLLYGSLRERSFSRLATEEAARILQLLGAGLISSLASAILFVTLTRVPLLRGNSRQPDNIRPDSQVGRK